MTEQSEDRAELARLITARRDLKLAMREQGIKRRSFMNGGLTDREYRANALGAHAVDWLMLSGTCLEFAGIRAHFSRFLG